MTLAGTQTRSQVPTCTSRSLERERERLGTRLIQLPALIIHIVVNIDFGGFPTRIFNRELSTGRFRRGGNVSDRKSLGRERRCSRQNFAIARQQKRQLRRLNMDL